jgi:hypothetical protein
MENSFKLDFYAHFTENQVNIELYRHLLRRLVIKTGGKKQFFID